MGREEFTRDILNETPPSGFLALSAVGDFAQIARQEKEISRLELQSGVNPFLSTFLFDITAAPLPDRLVEIDEWMFPYLSEDQMLAVRKMISTPAIFLLQGPPGTGKTVVATECAFQCVKRGEKVLISSQSNLAVDNVLDKFVPNPSVRAIRLGKDDKIEKGMKFSKKNALVTYYKSVSKACRDRFLDPWEKAEKRIVERKRWIRDADIIHADIKKFKNELTMLKKRRAEIEKKYSDEETRISENRIRQKEREGVKRFKEMLEERKNAVHAA